MELYIGGKHNGKLEHVLSKYNETIYFDITKNQLNEIKDFHIVNNVDEIIDYCLKNDIDFNNILGELKYKIVIGNIISNGVVPVDPYLRLLRDKVGIVYKELATQASCVYKIIYGIEVFLK